MRAGARTRACEERHRTSDTLRHGAITSAFRREHDYHLWLCILRWIWFVALYTSVDNRPRAAEHRQLRMVRTPRAAPPSFGADDFRAALAMFATGVTIVTARTPTASRSA